MPRLLQYIGLFLLGATLMAPVRVQARDRDDHNCPNNGYYDRDHKDCHGWNDREGHAYQSWETTRHRTHREFTTLKNRQRSEYWKWRHEHPDDDRDRH
jgi:hypothetical protein